MASAKKIIIGVVAAAAVIGFINIAAHSNREETAPASQQPPPKPALTAEQRDDLIKRATAGMAVDRDKMESITFYTPKGSPWAGTGIVTYIGIPDGGGPILRMMPAYHGDSWIFFDRIKVMADSKIVYEKSFDHFKMKHDNNTAGVYESVDYPADLNDVVALTAIAGAKSVTVRLAGDKLEDFELTDADRERIAQTLKAYSALSALQ